MEYRIKNTSKAAQGIYTVGGLVFVPPGATRSVVPLEIARVRKQPFFEVEEADAKVPPPSPEIAEAFAKFDRDGNGAPGGSLPKAEATPAKRSAPKRRRKRRAKAKK